MLLSETFIPRICIHGIIASRYVSLSATSFCSVISPRKAQYSSGRCNCIRQAISPSTCASCEIPSSLDHCYTTNNETYLGLKQTYAHPIVEEIEHRQGKATASAFSARFQFITNENEEEARKKTRSDVMREYWRQKRWQPTGKATGPVTDQTSAHEGDHYLVSSEELADEDDNQPNIIVHPVRSKRINGVDSLSPEEIWLETDPPNETSVQHTQDESMVVSEYYSAPSQRGSEKALFQFNLQTTAVGAMQVDPFSTLPFDCGPQTQALLHHCKPQCLHC